MIRTFSNSNWDLITQQLRKLGRIMVAMVESYFRIRAGATIFESEGLKPTTFSGAKALDFTYRYVGTDEVKRRGRTVIAVVNQKMYLMMLDGAAYYFDAAQPQFESLVASATL